MVVMVMVMVRGDINKEEVFVVENNGDGDGDEDSEDESEYGCDCKCQCQCQCQCRRGECGNGGIVDNDCRGGIKNDGGGNTNINDGGGSTTETQKNNHKNTFDYAYSYSYEDYTNTMTWGPGCVEPQDTTCVVSMSQGSRINTPVGGVDNAFNPIKLMPMRGKTDEGDEQH
eukprot:gnl/Chilomastix_caulleri/1713.p1 GENE.gnl/Chilomastix_caulleri/1713~~gnl/Chilomastix_caulleri/1713.p1  ORF type:complete len:171 (+),score=41.13 gnl/Chilomastix_caulleri/1713:187-699(+)